jgi:hypothetical protein
MAHGEDQFAEAEGAAALIRMVVMPSRYAREASSSLLSSGIFVVLIVYVCCCSFPRRRAPGGEIFRHNPTTDLRVKRGEHVIQDRP